MSQRLTGCRTNRSRPLPHAPPVPQPVGLSQPPSLPQPPCTWPLAFGSSYRRQHFSRPHRPDSFDGIEAEILLLGHLDRDRLERREKRRAAKRPAAGAVAADHLGLVADAHLPHLDARAELGGQLAHQLAEIDARLRP